MEDQNLQQEKELTYKEIIEALGKSTGVGFRMRGNKEIPQIFYENGFIEHTTSPIYGHTTWVTNYETIIFDNGDWKGKKFQFSQRG